MKCPKKQSNTDKEYYKTAFVYYMCKEKQSEAFLAVKIWAALALLSFFFLFCFTILLLCLLACCNSCFCKRKRGVRAGLRIGRIERTCAWEKSRERNSFTDDSFVCIYVTFACAERNRGGKHDIRGFRCILVRVFSFFFIAYNNNNNNNKNSCHLWDSAFACIHVFFLCRLMKTSSG